MDHLRLHDAKYCAPWHSISGTAHIILGWVSCVPSLQISQLRAISIPKCTSLLCVICHLIHHHLPPPHSVSHLLHQMQCSLNDIRCLTTTTNRPEGSGLTEECRTPDGDTLENFIPVIDWGGGFRHDDMGKIDSKKVYIIVNPKQHEIEEEMFDAAQELIQLKRRTPRQCFGHA